MTKHIIFLFCFLIFISMDSSGCTSAIISAELNPSGRPLLWKLRDTSTTDNKIEYVDSKDGSHGYVALYNAADKNLDEAWMGMNDVGFAIMNTASYNIKDDNIPEREMDKEGIIMSMALKVCETVDDFASLLDTLPKPLGVEANFGVIDSWGNGAYFETNNYEYVRFNLSDAKNKILVRTNYSHSGRKDEGFGYVREANAMHLLSPYVVDGNVSAELLTENVSRSFWHDLMKQDMLDSEAQWLVDQDFIPRYKSTATIVIEGCKPLDKNTKPSKDFIEKQYVMWTGLGYPPCSEIVPVWCSSKGVAPELRGLQENGTSEMGNKVKQRRDEVFPIHKDNGDKYINKSILSNEEGTGYIQVLTPINHEVYKKIAELRDKE